MISLFVPRSFTACLLGRLTAIVMLSAIVTGLLGCGSSPQSSETSIIVSILPLAELVERIAGEGTKVAILVGPGQSPHTYEPTPQQMAQLTSARILFRVGVPFEERLIEKIADQAPALRVVDLRMNVDMLAEGDHASCDHDHDHGELDPHIWLDPGKVKIMAKNIAAALVDLHPERAGVIQSNLATMDAELDKLDQELRATLANLDDRRFYVFHPAFGYLAQAYDLIQIPVEFEGKEPSARMIGQFIDEARAESVSILFVQPQFSAVSAEAIAEAVGCAVVSIDPLARDYFENLRSIADAIASAQGQPRSGEDL